MAQDLLVAQFHDYRAAHRAFIELTQSGIAPNQISLIAGDSGERYGASSNFGLLAAHAESYVGLVRRGVTLLAVQTEDSERGRIAAMIQGQGPLEIEERSSERAWSVTLSGAPADRPASPGELPGSAADKSRSPWLIRREGNLAAEVDPEKGG